MDEDFAHEQMRNAVTAERERILRVIENAVEHSKWPPEHMAPWRSACRTIMRLIRESSEGGDAK